MNVLVDIRRQIMLKFLPLIANALNAKGKVPIFSMVNHLREPTWDGHGCLLDYRNVLKALSNSSWIRFYDGWLGTTIDNPDQHTGAQLLPSLIEETALGLVSDCIECSLDCPSGLTSL